MRRLFKPQVIDTLRVLCAKLAKTPEGLDESVLR